MRAEIARQDVADGVEIRAAIMRDDALGIARGAGCITERNSVPFVLRLMPGEVRVAGRDRRFILESSTSIKSGFGPFIRSSASEITPENSGSTRMILAPP